MQIFKEFQATPVEPINIDEFVQQKEKINRYLALFESSGDTQRSKQTEGFIAAIDDCINDLQNRIQIQKKHENALSEEFHLASKHAYDDFIEVKKQFNNGKLEILKKRKALSKFLAEMNFKIQPSLSEGLVSR